MYNLNDEDLADELESLEEIEVGENNEKEEEKEVEKVEEVEKEVEKEYEEIEISEGMGAIEVAKMLSDTGLVDDESKFLRELKEKNKLRRIQYGNYEISPELNLGDLINKITLDS